MRVVLTGTPGTGKSSVAEVLRGRGLAAIEVSGIAKEAGLLTEMDEARDSFEVDIDELNEVVEARLKDSNVILVGHLAHLVRNDLCIVLRCRPCSLRARLQARGWSEAKVRENVEAEALDVILVEAVEQGGELFEVDTTTLTPDQVADSVLEIMVGKTEKYRPGHIDWSSEVLDWY